MINLKEDIQPLTTFRNNSVNMMKHLGKTGRPIVLTVNGKSKAILQDAAAYKRLLDIAALADEREAIRQGDEDAATGRTRPAASVFQQGASNMAYRVRIQPLANPSASQTAGRRSKLEAAGHRRRTRHASSPPARYKPHCAAAASADQRLRSGGAAAGNACGFAR